MHFNEIFLHNKRWTEDKLQLDPLYFERLAQGQQPEYLYIGCSDSRVSAEEMMGLQPGEVFVHRNIANLVISTDNNLNAVVQYAVEVLQVKRIILCGHYQCGGVKAAMKPSDMGQLNAWLQTLRDVYRLHQRELDAIEDESHRYDRLAELNVLEQCINLAKIDHVQKNWAKTGFPSIHGWIFDVHTGRIADLNFQLGEHFAKVKKIFYIQSDQKE